MQVWDERKAHRVDDEILIIEQPDGKRVKIDATDGNSSVGLAVAEARATIYE